MEDKDSSDFLCFVAVSKHHWNDFFRKRKEDNNRKQANLVFFVILIMLHILCQYNDVAKTLFFDWYCLLILRLLYLLSFSLASKACIQPSFILLTFALTFQNCRSPSLIWVALNHWQTKCKLYRSIGGFVCLTLL